MSPLALQHIEAWTKGPHLPNAAVALPIIANILKGHLPSSLQALQEGLPLRVRSAHIACCCCRSLGLRAWARPSWL